MSQQLLVNVLTVTVPAAGSVTVPHGLKSNGKSVAPKLVLPESPSPVSVGEVTDTSITFTNSDVSPVTAKFRVERGVSVEVDAETLSPLYVNFGAAIPPTPPTTWQFGSRGNPSPQTGELDLVATILPSTIGYMNLEIQTGKYYSIECMWSYFVIRNISGPDNRVDIHFEDSSGAPLRSVQLFVPAGGVVNVPEFMGATVNLSPGTVYITNPRIAINKTVSCAGCVVTYELSNFNFFGIAQN